MPVFANMMQGAASVVKSIQKGTISFDTNPGTATISSVNTAKAYVQLDGFGAGYTITSGSTNSRSWFPYVALSNATTVSANCAANPGSSAPATVAFTVVEFY